MSLIDTPPPSLYAAREPVFPRRVKGAFRTLKWWIMGFTLGIYYLAPWIRWDRGPALPDQAVLVDLAGRRFFMFWIEIWPHEFYFVAGLLIMAGLGLFLFTSALGRVWCGYACPQTVWTDLFILVERWTDGDRNARIKLWNAPWTVRKAGLRALKWSIWLLIAVATGGAWVFYFTDAPTLLRNLLTANAHPVAYVTILILTMTTFVFGGFMREQICIYACPWPRIQAAMLDEDSLTIGYRDWRGEPRGKHRKAEMATPLGDCIDCNACVAVCPMGIDIRDGQQMACITCGLCIDACNDVMIKVGSPPNLIGYLALSDEVAERAGGKPKSLWKHVFRPRTIMYTLLWGSVGMALIIALFIRQPIDMTVAPVRNPTFVTLSDGSVRNTYDLRLRNKNGEPRTFEISTTSTQDLKLSLEGQTGLVVEVPADQTLLQRLYVTTSATSPAATLNHSELRLWVADTSNTDRVFKDTVFTGDAR